MNDKPELSRRNLLHATIAAGGALALGACGRAPTHGLPSASSPPPGLTAPVAYRAAPVEPPTSPACRPTAPNIEGPFFRENAPFRSELPSAREGQRLLVRGRVTGADLSAIADAKLDVWHADSAGQYDNAGFAQRGQLKVDSGGHYEFSTVRPGHYKNGAQYRPAHVHVKISAPGKPTLTTQLYFPGDPYNEIDPFIDHSLIMDVKEESGVWVARFDFTIC